MSRNNSPYLTGAFLCITAAGLAGTGAIFAKLAYGQGFQPLSLLAVRFIAATGILAPIGLRLWPEQFRLSLLSLLQLIVLAIANLGAAVLYFSALELADASLVVPIFFSYPAAVLLLRRLYGDRLSYKHVLALGIGWSGIWLVSGADVVTHTGAILFSLAAAGCFAIYVVVAQTALENVGTQAGVTYVMVFLAVGASVLWVVSGQKTGDALTGWGILLMLVLISTVGARLAFFAGLRRIGSNYAALLNMSEPLAILLMAAVILGEHLTPVQWLGTGLILGSGTWSLSALQELSSI